MRASRSVFSRASMKNSHVRLRGSRYLEKRCCIFSSHGRRVSRIWSVDCSVVLPVK
jgi:hypothetical protein